MHWHRPDAGPAAVPPAPVGRFRVVCVHCTATGHLSSRGLFLHRSAVLRHIRGSKPCFAADLGFKEINVEARAGDVMAGAGGRLVRRRTYVTNLQVE